MLLGIFRVSRSLTTMNTLRSKFANFVDYNLKEGPFMDVHAISGIFKAYLRELPESILSNELKLELRSIFTNV
jgi:RalA-binding protein 1